eukprot:1286360-Amphidinium_carterae.1
MPTAASLRARATSCSGLLCTRAGAVSALPSHICIHHTYTQAVLEQDLNCTRPGHGVFCPAAR